MDARQKKDIEDIIESMYGKGPAKTGHPKMWCYCQDCIIVGSYDWCPKKKLDTQLEVEAEEGCPVGKRLLN